MIDFTNCKINNFKYYGGKNGGKICIKYNNEEMEARVYTFPTSALKINDKKINYFEYINSLENEECNKALLRIFPRIIMAEIEKIIDETIYISIIRKEFYKKILNMRYEKILKFSYNKLCQ